MTTALRRSGGCVAYSFEGKVNPRDPVFGEMLETQRFRSIDTAASEEVSVGWVTPADPSGNSFAVEDMDGGGDFAWLRIRIDVKRLPPTLYQLRLAEAEKARGKKLSSRERRELKEDLIDKVLPGIPPSTTFVDAILDERNKRVLVLTTAKAQLEAFCKLWDLVTELPLDRETVVSIGGRAGLDDVAKASPTRWPGGAGEPRQMVIGEAAFLGDEFLTWLWWKWEADGGEFALPGGRMVGVMLDDMIAFSSASENETDQVLRHGQPTRTEQARASLREGRCVTKAKLVMAEGQHVWNLVLDGATLALAAVKLPDDAEECESSDDRTADRVANWITLHRTMNELVLVFLRERLAKSWAKKTAVEMAEWMECEPVTAGDVGS